MIRINPINQNRIAKISFKNSSNTSQTQTQPQVKTTTENSVNSSSSSQEKTRLIDKIKANKKIIIPAVIGLSVVIGGLIYAIKKGKLSFRGKVQEEAAGAIAGNTKPIEGTGAEVQEEAAKILNDAEDIKKLAIQATDEAKNIQQRSVETLSEIEKQFAEFEKTITEASDTNFQDVHEESGNLVRRIIKDKNSGAVIIEDLDGEKISRRTEISLNEIEDNGFRNIFINYDRRTDGTIEYKKAYRFRESNGMRKATYLSNATEQNDKLISAEELMKFTEGEDAPYLTEYAQGITTTSRGEIQPKQLYTFHCESTKLATYTEYTMQTTSTSSKVDTIKEIFFNENGEIAAATRIETDSNGSMTKDMFDFINNQLSRVTKESTIDEKTTTKVFDFKDGKLVKPN